MVFNVNLGRFPSMLDDLMVERVEGGYNFVYHSCFVNSEGDHDFAQHCGHFGKDMDMLVTVDMGGGFSGQLYEQLDLPIYFLEQIILIDFLYLLPYSQLPQKLHPLFTLFTEATYLLLSSHYIFEHWLPFSQV